MNLGLGLMAAKGYYDEDARQRQLGMQESRLGLEQARGDREGRKFARDEKQWADQDDFKNEQKDWYAKSRRAATEQEGKNALTQWEQEHSAYQDRLKAGQSPDSMGTAPVKPVAPMLTTGDMLADTASYLDLQAKHGKYDPLAWQNLAKASQEYRKEGTIEAANLFNRGDLNGGIEAFNRTGRFKINPADVVDFKPFRFNADGVTIDTHELSVRRPDGSVMRINAAQELENAKVLDNIVDRRVKASKMSNDTREADARVTSSNASLANANASAGLHGTQQRAAQLQLDQANLAIAARRKQAAGQALTPEEQAALVYTGKEAKNEYQAIPDADTSGNFTVLNKDLGQGARYDKTGQRIGTFGLSDARQESRNQLQGKRVNVPDGSHKLKDGSVVTVKNGVVQ